MRRSVRICTKGRTGHGTIVIVQKSFLTFVKPQLDSVSLLQYTIEQLKNVSIREVQMNAITEQEKKEFIFKIAVAFEDFTLKYGRYHLNESMPNEISNDYSKLVLRIRRVFSPNGSDFHLEGPGKQTFIDIPSINFDNNGSVLVVIMYTDLHELLKSSGGATKNSTRQLNTIIMAVSMDSKPKLQQNVVMKFRNLKVAEAEKYCVFWSGFSGKNPDGWSGEGCHAVRSNSKQTECSCNHMTHFAVLFGSGPKITETDDKILTILTYVGLTLSIIGIILTIISYAVLTDVHQPLSQIRVSLAGSLGAGQIIFLAGVDQTNNTGVCVTVAALMQYFLMAAFCWMLVEGIYLYFFVVKVYNINNKMSIYHVMSWGVPAVVVAISLSIAAGEEGIQSFVSNKYCWMSSANRLIWIFAAFVVMVEVFNLLILVRVIKEMTTMQPTGDKHAQQIRIGIRACVVMIPLLGVTWLFGLVSPLHKAFVYIFTILNSTQGFLIFLLHCVRHSQIRERFKARINRIFPAANNGISAKRTSQVNQSDVGALQLRAIEVQRCSDDAGVIELN
ncbi:hypothetical protein OS493_014580 [Desmophyllum pertusum]|uniref:Uncharacterized protein n=1 Tax=Desmophyllum pertusum TaxID=174260 RepID=A0A9W9YQ55_9CNID|nr:hypothetical protein OS493_014580 [Desmophyllum pertusum]